MLSLRDLGARLPRGTVLGIGLSAALALGIVACGSDDEGSGPSNTAGTGGSTASGGTGGGTAGTGGTAGQAGEAGSGGDAGSGGEAGTGGGTGGTGGTGGVGENLIAGYNHWDPPWVAGTNSLGFVFHSVEGGADYDSGATLGEHAFGYNGDPFDKIDDFQNMVLNEGIGAKTDVAGFKYCYNDITVDTTSDADDVIAAYQAAYGQIESQTSGVAFFHITTPLQPENEYQTVENNTLRVKFADFLKASYAGGRHVVFDLQEIESTTAGGDSCTQSGVPVLCAEWAGDNDGHLNDAAATRAAKAFLYTMHVARGL